MKNLIKLFQKNIQFLKKNQNKLYQEIINCEKNILKNQRYYLEYHNDSLNIFDSKNGTYLIPKNSNFDASFKEHQLENSPKQSISLIQTHPIKFKKYFDYNIDSYKFINEYIKSIDFNNIQIKEYKFIFFGVVLGLDINAITNKAKSNSYLFIEKEIELFRLSLFITPYYKIAKTKSLFFAVGDNYTHQFTPFVNNRPHLNHFIKYSISTYNNKSYINDFINYIEQNNPLMYTFSEYIGAYKRGLNYINKSVGFLNFENNLKSKTILYLGSGPSLEKEIDFIKKCKNDFFIVAIAATLKLLENHKIKPDMIISIDGSTKIENQFKYLNKKFLKDIPIILSLSTHKKVLKYLKDKNCFFVQTNTIFTNNLYNFTGTSAGEIGLDIILKLKPKDIYLLGFDLSINTINTHISTHTNAIGQEEVQNQITWKGNFKRTVSTINRFLQLRQNFIEKLLNNDIPVYNLSDGLYIDYTIPCKTIDVRNISTDKNIVLSKHRIQKIKKDKDFLQQILFLYEELTSPYSSLLTSQDNYDKIKLQQIKQIENYYANI